MNKNKLYFNFVSDFILNLVANAINISFLQLIILPMIAKNTTEIHFGEISSIYGINTIIFLTLGGSLGTLRLTKRNENGDNFSLLSVSTSIIAIVVSLALFTIYGKHLNIIDIFLYSISTGMISYISYATVIFRINMDFKKVLFQNITTCIGYSLGIIIFKITSLWSIIFLIGYLFSIVFILKYTNIFNENISKNSKFGLLFIEYKSLSLATFFNSGLGNLDRFLIVPLLGSPSMGVFFASSSVSRILNLLINPLANVLLSYIVQSDKTISKKEIIKIQVTFFILGIVIAIPTYVVSIICVRFLYPNIYFDYTNIKIITFIVGLGTIFLSLWNLLNSYFLKLFKMKFQVISNILYGLLYFTLALSLGNLYGLYGFCIAYAGSAVFKFFITGFMSITTPIEV